MSLPSDRRMRQTLAEALAQMAQLITAPRRCFQTIVEPVDHGRVLSCLYVWRIPTWFAALAIYGLQLSGLELPGLPPLDLTQPYLVSPWLGDALRDSLAFWLLCLVPIGLPVLYFFGGIFSHIAMALTGATGRSIGASMRAFGLAALPALSAAGLVEIALRLEIVPPAVWLAILGAASLWTFAILGFGLARTHLCGFVRAYCAALLPWAFLLTAVVGRTGLLLPAPREGPDDLVGREFAPDLP